MAKYIIEITVNATPKTLGTFEQLLSGISPYGAIREIDEVTHNESIVKCYLDDDRQAARKLLKIEMLTLALAESADNPLRTLSIRRVSSDDWATRWQEHFKPIPVSDRIAVVPYFHTGTTGKQIEIIIKPGLAFGTGSHETTFMVMQAIEQFAPKAHSMLDVGAGSGILAILAYKLGIARVEGIDNDRMALRNARENRTLNGVKRSAIRFADTPLAKLEGSFDLVVANILAETLIELAPALVPRVAPGGRLILSGILTEKATSVAKTFRALGLGLTKKQTMNEWSMLVMGR